MAHFAEIGIDGKVIRVLVVGNDVITDAGGVERESLGVQFLKSLFGVSTNWRQTSYNGNIRKNYAGIGYTYDAARDAFISPQPFPSWVFNENTCGWDAPVPMPQDGKVYRWDEGITSWVEVQPN